VSKEVEEDGNQLHYEIHRAVLVTYKSGVMTRRNSPIK